MFKFFKIVRAPYVGLVFIYAVVTALSVHANDDQLNQISNSREWKALLYYKKSSFIIKDQSFYLSDERTIDSELRRLILEIKNNKSVICRFPARYTYLTTVLDYSIDELKNCNELNEFKRRAPLNRASVVFASENISIPSSMMGHIYLKIEGVNHLQKHVEHAISFFTDVDDYNIPKLIFDTLIVGKKGFYALTPNAPLIRKYLMEEERNVWEYDLNLNSYQKELLHNHLYELKNINLRYYFHTFNCATLIDKIINVISPTNDSNNYLWITPLDIVRNVKNRNLLDTTSVYLANKWKIKALQENYVFDNETLNLIKHQNSAAFNSHIKHVGPEKSFLSTELMRAYLQFKGNSTDELKESHKDFNLDLSHYKNPNQTKSTSQVFVQYDKLDKENIYKLTWLPASHLIEDDSSNYIYESELQIARLTMAYSEEKKKFLIDEFNVYSATSLQATDYLTGGLSGKVRIGYSNYFNSDLIQNQSIITQGSVGKTIRVHHDVDSFGLLGLSYTEANSAMFAPDLELGLIVREVFGMKTIMSLKYQFEDINKNESLLNYNFKHFIDFNEYGLLLDYNNFMNQNGKHAQKFSIGVKVYF